MDPKQFLGTIVGTIARIAIAAFIIYAVFKCSVSAYNFGFQIFADVPVDPINGRTVTLTVTSGEGTKEVAADLAKKGLIEDANIFVIQEKLSEYKDMMKPGTYQLSTSMTATEMLEIMSNGEVKTDDADMDNSATDSVEEEN